MTWFFVRQKTGLCGSADSGICEFVSGAECVLTAGIRNPGAGGDVEAGSAVDGCLCLSATAVC